MDFGAGCVSIHGYLLRDGEWSKLASGRREVVERDGDTGYPLAVHIDGVDELGRTLSADGRCLNRLGLFLNPNLFTVNSLTEWSFDGVDRFRGRPRQLERAGDSPVRPFLSRLHVRQPQSDKE